MSFLLLLLLLDFLPLFESSMPVGIATTCSVDVPWQRGQGGLPFGTDRSNGKRYAVATRELSWTVPPGGLVR